MKARKLLSLILSSILLLSISFGLFGCNQPSPGGAPTGTPSGTLPILQIPSSTHSFILRL